MRNKLWIIGVCAALLAGVTGCGTKSAGTGANSTTSPTTNAAGKEPFKIGITLPMSGPAALSGEQTMNGVKLAMDKINQKGGVLGSPIDVIVYDDKANPEEGVNTIKKLITRDQVKFTVGGLQSSVSLAQVSAVRDKGVLQSVLTSKAPKITEEGHDLLFRYNTSSTMDGGYFPTFIKDTVQPKTLAIVAEQTDYGKAEVDVIKNAFANGGPKIVGVEWVQNTDTDFTSQLTKVKSLNADAVYYITSPPATFAALLTQSKELGFNNKKIMAIGNLNKDLIKLAGDAANGVICADIYLNSSDDPANQEFVKAFQPKYNYVPEKYELLGYEAITIMAQAIEKAGKFDPAEVAKVMKSGKWTSPRGELTFDQKGQAISKNYFPQTVKDGKIVMYKN